MLNQAFMAVTQGNSNVLYQCYTTNSGFVTSDCNLFWTAYKTKIKAIKTYTGAVDGVNLPDYLGTDLIAAEGGTNRDSTCSGGKVAGKSSKQAWTLVDGSIIMSYGALMTSIGMFIVDTNGLKGPNKWGYDIFLLDFSGKDRTNQVVINDLRCGAKESGGYWVGDILTE